MTTHPGLDHSELGWIDGMAFCPVCGHITKESEEERMSKQPITVYLAAGYDRAWEMREFRAQLRPYGWEVTSRWIDNKTDDKPISTKDLFEPTRNARPETIRESREAYTRADQECMMDIEDINGASTFMVFTSTPSTAGGRHTELGMAMALGKRIIIIGPRENVFQVHPNIEQHDTFHDFILSLQGV